jgi:hypothetical protein
MNDAPSLDLPPMPLPPQLHQESFSDLLQPQQQLQQEEEQEVTFVAGTFGTTKSSESLQEYIGTDSSRSSISIVELGTTLLPSPSRSETPSTDRSSVHLPKKSIVANNLSREYYDDDILSSDFDQESEDDIAAAKMAAAIKELPTPPTTPLSTKFSAKRILHRAKSSIADESSVKKLGRRTSMFLEKFHHPHQQEVLPPLPPLPPAKLLTLPVSPSDQAADAPSSLKSIRRQSSKLTNKGKTLSKKLRKVISFHHHPNQLQDAR